MGHLDSMEWNRIVDWICGMVEWNSGLEWNDNDGIQLRIYAVGLIVVYHSVVELILVIAGPANSFQSPIPFQSTIPFHSIQMPGTRPPSALSKSGDCPSSQYREVLLACIGNS